MLCIAAKYVQHLLVSLFCSFCLLLMPAKIVFFFLFATDSTILLCQLFFFEKIGVAHHRADASVGIYDKRNYPKKRVTLINGWQIGYLTALGAFYFFRIVSPVSMSVPTTN